MSKRRLNPAAPSLMASFSAAGLLGVMAARPWYAAVSFFIAAVAFFSWVRWPS